MKDFEITQNNYEKYILKNLYTHSKNIKKILKLQKDLFNIQIKKIPRTQNIYFNLVKEVLIGYDENSSRILEDLVRLIKGKKYFSSMFLLRGLIEYYLYSIYITFKIFYHLKTNNFEGIIKIICRASISAGKESIATETFFSNDLYCRLFNKFKNNRIHINDCLEFNKKQNWVDLFSKDYSRVQGLQKFDIKKHFKLTKGSKFILKKFERFLEYNKSNLNFSGLDYIYFKLCEIIHPTAIILHKHNNKISIVDFKNLITGLYSTDILPISVLALDFKALIFDWLITYRNEFVSKFKDSINK